MIKIPHKCYTTFACRVSIANPPAETLNESSAADRDREKFDTELTTPGEATETGFRVCDIFFGTSTSVVLRPTAPHITP